MIYKKEEKVETPNQLDNKEKEKPEELESEKKKILENRIDLPNYIKAVRELSILGGYKNSLETFKTIFCIILETY